VSFFFAVPVGLLLGPSRRGKCERERERERARSLFSASLQRGFFLGIPS
jgi:hypothetical protein